MSGYFSAHLLSSRVKTHVSPYFSILSTSLLSHSTSLQGLFSETFNSQSKLLANAYLGQKKTLDRITGSDMHVRRRFTRACNSPSIRLRLGSRLSPSDMMLLSIELLHSVIYLRHSNVLVLAFQSGKWNSFLPFITVFIMYLQENLRSGKSETI